ncbi:MAG: NAD-dependent epimerase/dehydratase family protein [Gemmatimonadales bacterium]
MKVLVTGATGFVGGHLVDRLLEQGDTVTALVRSPSRAAPLGQRGVRLVPGDLSNLAALGNALDGIDLVYHAAAILGSPSEDLLMAANRDGTANVGRLAASMPARPRVVLVSSMAAGGPAKKGAPRTIDDADQPVTAYGRSKLASEQALATSGARWCAVRAPVVYGPRDREGFLPLFKAAKFGLAPTFGDGSMEVSLIYVSDLVDALLLAGTTPSVESRTFYVNHPEIVTGAVIVRTIARAMHRTPLPIAIPRWAATAALGITGAWADLLGRKSILFPDKIHEFYQEAWTADPAPFVSVTGWRPAMNLERGIAETAAWYANAGWI